MRTWTWIVKKIGYTAILWFLTVSVTILVILATPVNPGLMLLTGFLQQGIPYNQAVEMVRAYIGFSPDEPIWVSWLRYTRSVLTGNLGLSITYRIPVSQLIAGALPWSTFFTTYSLTITVILGVIIGLAMAYYREKALIIRASMGLLTLFNSIPNWILAAILFVYIGARWKLLPYTGAYDPGVSPDTNLLAFIASVLHHYTLPVLTMVITSLPGWAFSMSAMATSVLKEDYITAAKARGLPSRRVILSYVAKNSILPIYTQIAISFAWLLVGTVWIEAQFLLPGLGSLLSVTTGSRDYPVIIGVYVVFITAMILGNLLTDLTYGLIDPRARVVEE